MLRTNRQTNKQTDSNVLPTQADRVGVYNKRMKILKACNVREKS